jgi:hypothetical protein
MEQAGSTRAEVMARLLDSGTGGRYRLSRIIISRLP